MNDIGCPGFGFWQTIMNVLKEMSGYLELTKPRVTLLNLLVGLVSLLLVPVQLTFYRLLPFLIAGYLVTGGCGSLNCWYDRDIDSAMQRTSHRVLPNGFFPASYALIFGLILLLSGFLTAFLFLPLLTVVMMATGAGIYLLIYTAWLKRSSSLNVVIGGTAICFAAFAGWTATGALFPSSTPFAIAILGFLWTPGHFWTLAIRRDEEYRRTRIPMLPTITGRISGGQAVFTWNAATVIYTLFLPALTNTDPISLGLIIPAGAFLLYFSGSFLRVPSNQRAERLFFYSLGYLMSILLVLPLSAIL